MYLKQIAHRMKQMRADKSNRKNKLIPLGVILTSLSDEESDDRAFTRVETIVETELSKMSEGDDDPPEHWPMMNECPDGDSPDAYRQDNPRSSSSGKRRRGHGKSQECWREPHLSRVSPLEGTSLGRGIKRNNEIIRLGR